MNKLGSRGWAFEERGEKKSIEGTRVVLVEVVIDIEGGDERWGQERR